MSRSVFFATSSVEPSERWWDAFSDGVRVSDLAAVQPGDLIWVDTAENGWAERLAQLAAPPCGCAVILLSNSPDDDEALRGLEAGARGYCHAHAVPSLLREVAEVVERGGLWVGPGLVTRLIAAIRPRLPAPRIERASLLSVREREVAQAVAAGASNKEVASRLGISERTVKAHLGSIFEKLGVRDRLHMVLLLAEEPGSVQGGRR